MARVLARLYYQFPIMEIGEEAMGTLSVRFRSHYRKRTSNGVEVLPQSMNPSWTSLGLVFPNELLLRPEIIRDRLSNNFAILGLDIDPEHLDDVAHDVAASYASALGSRPPAAKGYFVRVDMECCHLIQVDEESYDLETRFAKLDSVKVSDAMDSAAMADVLERGFAYLESVLDSVLDPDGIDSAPVGNFLESVVANLNSVRVPDPTEWEPRVGGTGASRKMIAKLIKNGGRVTGETDQKLGTCPVCLEELSSSAGTQLLRTDCAHIFHRPCLLQWLEKRITCPYCRRRLDYQ